MKLKIIIPFVFLTGVFASCSSDENKNVASGPLISELDKKEKEVEKTKIDSTLLISAPIEKLKNNLINNSNVIEKLTAFGQENKETKVKIRTKFGNIKIRLFEDTPLHRANFVMLTKRNYFDSTLFYRVFSNFVIQGGNSDRDNVAIKMSKIGNYKIPDEIKSNHIHKRGVIAMAVHEQEGVADDKKDKRSSPYNFYIVQQKSLSDDYMDRLEERYKFKISSKNRKIYKKYGGVPHLDGDFTVFGEVYSGMSTVDKIAQQSTNAYDRPIDDIFISVEIIE